MTLVNISLLERCKGALVGLAIGDALGTTLEFKKPGSFKPITDMVGGGPFNMDPGKWTDDTSMALCLADSLIEFREFNALDQMEKYLKWYKSGYNSSKGYCFDIGNTTMYALDKFEETQEPFCGMTAPDAAGNGSIMRLAPIPIVYHNDFEDAIKMASASSLTTHGAPQCLDACKYMSILITAAIRGFDKETLLSKEFCEKQIAVAYLNKSVKDIIEGSYKTKEEHEIKGTGYVISTLEAALWAFCKTDNFEDGALKVVNLGDDADTTGAVYGQIAGAYYGIGGIPEKWLDKLYKREAIEKGAEELFKLSQTFKK